LSATSRCQRDSIIGLEVVAEVRLELVFDVFGSWLAALIVFARIEEAAVLAAVNIS
jgi:hypothetical protein